MEAKRTSVYENSLIWFGAGVSIAEILTGTYFAPLGFQRACSHPDRPYHRLLYDVLCRADRRAHAKERHGDG